jgi:signal transduction histidine kinase
VLAAGAGLSLLGRQSLLSLERTVRGEQIRVASIAGAALARDLVADLETLQSAVSGPHVQQARTDVESWSRQLAASARGLRLADGLCYVDAEGVPVVCTRDDLGARAAGPQIESAIRQSIVSRRPVVSAFAGRKGGGSDAVAVVPVVAPGGPSGAAVAIIADDGPQVRSLLPDTRGASFTLQRSVGDSLPEDAPPEAAVAGAPWAVRVMTPVNGRDTVLAFRRLSFWFAPSLAAVAMLMAWGVVLSVQRPLLKLTEAAERIAAGDLSSPIAGGRDEIGRLGSALENMRARLKQSIEASDRANADLERRVAQRTSQLQRLLGKVISAQEDERRRVARELHDETSQVLAGLGMALQAVATSAGPARLQELKALVDRMHDGLHRLIVNLRPAVLDDLGLAAAINGLVDAQLRHAGFASVACELEDIKDLRADPSVEIAIFRVVQESILNVVRHSGAQSVLVEASLEKGRLCIQIEDDGKGFEPAEIRRGADSLRGVGLDGMRERMDLIGGQLTIDSAPGAGTHVRIEVPVKAAAEATV